MSAFDPDTALARWIGLWNRRDREFQALPDFQQRCARGDYDFFSRVDLDLDRLREVAQQHGFRLDWTWNSSKQQIVYGIEQMPPEEYEPYLMASREEGTDDAE